MHEGNAPRGFFYGCLLGLTLWAIGAVGLFILVAYR